MICSNSQSIRDLKHPPIVSTVLPLGEFNGLDTRHASPL